MMAMIYDFHLLDYLVFIFSVFIHLFWGKSGGLGFSFVVEVVLFEPSLYTV